MSAASGSRVVAGLEQPHSSHNVQTGPEEPGLSTSYNPRRKVYETMTGINSIPIHQSIEEDPPEHLSMDNAAPELPRLQIQQSVENERSVPHSGGFALPTRPIFEEAEYAISLPAEGRVQAIYHNAIKNKKKAILKFIRKQESSGSRSQRKTNERNEMAQLMGQLNDIVTHIDLGLDDSATQYSLQSEENARYAPYAGSKFAFLNHLLNHLSGKDCSIVIVARGDRTQDLLEGYLRCKGVVYHRPSQGSRASTPKIGLVPMLKVVLLTAWSSASLNLTQSPTVIIAFDSSFDIHDPLIKTLRDCLDKSTPVPVVHLLVMNSSEHVDACIPQQLPSPQRFRLLVRATYQARNNLGGGPSIIPQGDELSGKNPVNLLELQTVVKKSPERRLEMIASAVATAITSIDFRSNWTVESMPELELDEWDDSPFKSERTRSVTPLSRAGTPNRKRFLVSNRCTIVFEQADTWKDVDGSSSNMAKRQRLTPLHDVAHVTEQATDAIVQLEILRTELAQLHEQLADEGRLRTGLEDRHKALQLQLDEHCCRRVMNSKALTEILPR